MHTSLSIDATASSIPSNGETASSDNDSSGSSTSGEGSSFSTDSTIDADSTSTDGDLSSSIGGYMDDWSPDLGLDSSASTAYDSTDDVQTPSPRSYDVSSTTMDFDETSTTPSSVRRESPATSNASPSPVQPPSPNSTEGKRRLRKKLNETNQSPTNESDTTVEGERENPEEESADNPVGGSTRTKIEVESTASPVFAIFVGVGFLLGGCCCFCLLCCGKRKKNKEEEKEEQLTKDTTLKKWKAKRTKDGEDDEKEFRLEETDAGGQLNSVEQGADDFVLNPAFGTEQLRQLQQEEQDGDD
jgi:hypothetical protein